jgi:UDP-N-acetylmuramyl pentapeptide phosphotransferase/UDP-N-acetylglucosamine-1-phosphate transferase
VALVLALAATVLVLVPIRPEGLAAGLLIAAVAAVSLVDDVRSLSFAPRLAVQVIAAVGVVWLLEVPARAVDRPGWDAAPPRGWGAALAVVFLVAHANFFNFMDGINGLAAGQAVVTGATLAVVLHAAGRGPAAVVAAATAGAAAGFLPHNFPAARIFLGDVGSVTLGFLLALLALVAHARGGVPWSAILLIHAAFLFDALVTIARRARRGESLVRPHREHHYQLLVRAGWSHTATTLTVLALSAGCCGAAWLSTRSHGWARWAALLGPLVALVVFAAVAQTRRPVVPGGPDPALIRPDPVAHG